jgi:hypothetical protein
MAAAAPAAASPRHAAPRRTAARIVMPRLRPARPSAPAHIFVYKPQD